ncbi:hypothetical protein TNCV_3892941 [Trichonephila clavipes]|nr:hypothetical protein TNCV_3892941 [Trichonephila clavipes]
MALPLSYRYLSLVFILLKTVPKRKSAKGILAVFNFLKNEHHTQRKVSLMMWDLGSSPGSHYGLSYRKANSHKICRNSKTLRCRVVEIWTVARHLKHHPRHYTDETYRQRPCVVLTVNVNNPSKTMRSSFRSFSIYTANFS